MDGGPLYNYAGPGQFALKTTFGEVSPNTLPSGLHFNIPLAQYTHDYNSQVQTINFTAGGHYFLPFGDSTEDQNTLLADIALNYRVTHDTEKLGFHRWAMDGFVLQDGFWLLTKMMNDSTNAVMGKQSLAKTADNPEKFTQDFFKDLSIRLEQNNIPVEIESVELKEFSTFFPTRTVSYQKKLNPNVQQTLEPKF